MTDPVGELKHMIQKLEYCQTEEDIQDINHRLLQIYRENTEYRKIARMRGISIHPFEFTWSSARNLLSHAALEARGSRNNKRAVRLALIDQKIDQMSTATVSAQRKILGKILKLAKRDDYVVQHGKSATIAATPAGSRSSEISLSSLSSGKSVKTHTQNRIPPSLDSAEPCCCFGPRATQSEPSCESQIAQRGGRRTKAVAAVTLKGGHRTKAVAAVTLKGGHRAREL